MGWVIAAPSRDLSKGGDRRKLWPPPIGGATGVIESPSRDAAARGEGVGQRYDLDPPLDGDSGIVDIGQYSPPPFDWSTGGWHGSPRYPMPTPRGLSVTHYLRMYFANLAGMLGFSVTGSATTERTTNDNDLDTPSAAAPIPFDFKRSVYTMREPFDARIYSDYLPNEKLQLSQKPRELAKGVRAQEPQMLEPYFPLLTRWQQPGSYGQRTITLESPAGTTAPPGAS